LAFDAIKLGLAEARLDGADHAHGDLVLKDEDIV